MSERMPHEMIDHNFMHHPPTPEKVTQHEQARAGARILAHDWTDRLPPSREKSLAMTKLEEALFWANAAIARN